MKPRSIVIQTYDRTDLRSVPVEYGDETHRYSFMADVAGSNPDIFPGDNCDVAKKLKELGALGKEDVLDPESCCLFVYFKTEAAGAAFLKKLSSYIRMKARLIRKAEAF